MQTFVFKIPNRDLQVLLTLEDGEQPTIAFRPGFGTWGPPISPMSDEVLHLLPLCDSCGDELEWGTAHHCDVSGTTVLVDRRGAGR